MIKINQYVKVNTLEEGYELCQKRNNTILGGMLWLKMQNKNVNVAIDLSNVVSDKIEETETEYVIGAMTTLRELEKNVSLNNYTSGCAGKSVESIVGVQFRNVATIGGSLFGKFGFSDVVTLFLALEAKLEFYKKGIISLEDYLKERNFNDILVNVIVPKKKCMVAYESQRNTKTDFPLLACSVAKCEEKYIVSIGARPMVAKAVVVEKFSEEIVENYDFGNNHLGSKEYRKHIAKVLLKRCFEKIEGKEGA